jgi:hypothetical protein
VALVGSNAWWTYDFDPSFEVEETMRHLQDYYDISLMATATIGSMAYHDAAYIRNTVRRLQTHSEVKAIVMITHTVPAPWIIAHDIDLVDTWRYNGMGNSHIASALDEDTQHKIKLWCFGHYHKSVDQDLGGVRYMCNPRGRGNTPWSQPAFYPRRIEIDV